MRILVLSALLLAPVVASGVPDDSRFPVSSSVERTFSPGGTVRLDLSAGGYRLQAGEDNRIRVTWRTRTTEQMEDTKVRVAVRGTQAEVHTDGPRNDFRVEIELPGRSDLLLRMTAGDLAIAGIDGNKDVRLRAGDLSIEVADPADYRRVNASVTAGDLSARPFGFSTGGLFRSFAHEGQGRFQLRARLWAGDLRLVRAKSASAAR